MTEEQNIYDDCHFKSRLTEEKKPAFTTEPQKGVTFIDAMKYYKEKDFIPVDFHKTGENNSVFSTENLERLGWLKKDWEETIINTLSELEKHREAESPDNCSGDIIQF